MSYTSSQPPAGWYPDPAGSGGERFWDGTAWSQATRDAQPVAPPPEPPQQEHPQSGAPPYGWQPHGVQPPPASPQQPYQGKAPYGPQYGATPYQGATGQVLVAAQGGRPLAKFLKRFGAWVLDYLLTFLLVLFTTSNLSARVSQGLEIYLTNLLISLQDPTAPVPSPPDSLWADYFLMLGVIAAIHVGYRILTNGFLGSTLGEKVLKLGVARTGDESLAKIGWSTAIARGLFSGVMVALGVFLGFLELLFAAFTKRRQALHDKVSKTVVYEV